MVARCKFSGSSSEFDLRLFLGPSKISQNMCKLFNSLLEGFMATLKDDKRGKEVEISHISRSQQVFFTVVVATRSPGVYFCLFPLNHGRLPAQQSQSKARLKPDSLILSMEYVHIKS